MRFIRSIKERVWAILLVLLLLFMAGIPILFYFTVFEPPYSKVGELYWLEKGRLPILEEDEDSIISSRIAVEGEDIYVIYIKGAKLYYFDSNDGGQSWSNPILIETGYAEGYTDLSSPKIINFENKIVITWLERKPNYGKNSWRGPPQQIKYIRSENRGKDWSNAHILLKNDKDSFLWLRDVKKLNNDMYLIGEKDSGGGWIDENFTIHSYLYVSKDFGKTWQNKTMEFLIDSKVVSCMQLELLDGKLLLRADFKPNKVPSYSFETKDQYEVKALFISEDGGDTWEYNNMSDAESITDFVVEDNTLHAIIREGVLEIYYTKTTDLKNWTKPKKLFYFSGDPPPITLLANEEDAYIISTDRESYNPYTGERYGKFRARKSGNGGDTWSREFPILPEVNKVKVEKKWHKWIITRRKEPIAFVAESGKLHMIWIKQKKDKEGYWTEWDHYYSHTISKEEANKLFWYSVLKTGLASIVPIVVILVIAKKIYRKKVKNREEGHQNKKEFKNKEEVNEASEDLG